VSSEPTFGARYRALPTARERLELDDAENRREAFAEADATLDRLVLAALQGERVVAEGATLTIPDGEREALTERFSVERRQERGAWYVPKLDELPTGRIHLVHWWQKAPRYALSLANSERPMASARANAARQANTDLVVIWAALEPIFEELALPLLLRSGRMAGQKPTEKQLPYWAKTIEPIYEALGAGMDAVRQFAPGTGWGDLGAAEVTARRDALLAGWVRADIDTARRLRTHRIGQLVDRYYSKAKNGRAARKRVIKSEDFERTLTAYFGGGWLAFLNYLGEEPEAGEEITTSLPETRLTGTSSTRAAEVAAEHGLPPEEVERMLAAYWRQSGGGTPVEQRVHVLERLWRELDAVHARQAPGMPSLFGLLGSSYYSSSGPAGESTGDARVFSAELLADMQHCWGTKLSSHNLERLVTEPHWGAAAARALGPAFDYWQHTAMNAWEMCEGGRVHSDFESLERRLSGPVFPLADTGCPVDARLFADLRAAESKLGPIEQEWERVDPESEDFVTIDMRVSRGAGRKGFEILRDIITRHRRAWADRYLTAYLEGRWKTELRAAGEAYNRHAAAKGKPPTIKQFAALANDAADHWFGGDLTGVYGALGLRSPLSPPTYTRLLPMDSRAFTRRVRQELDTAAAPADRPSGEQGMRLSAPVYCIRWVELAEALGTRPTLKQFGARSFAMSAGVLNDDPETAWRMYCDAIECALAGESMPARPAQPVRAAAGEPAERSAPVAAAATADSAHPANPDDGVAAQASAKRAPEPTAPPGELRGLLRRFDGR
jgi:hypothetical protein